MKLNFVYKKIFKPAILIAGLAISASASAGIINGDFSADLNGWGGDVVYYDAVNDIDNNNELNVDFTNFTDNFSTGINSVTLNTSANINDEYWGVYLFQEFMVASDSHELSLNFDAIADYAYVTLVDENLDLIHDFMKDGLSADISRFGGSSVSLEFGVEDVNFQLDDYLTVSNISISKQSLQVPEPSSFAIFALALLALRSRLITRKERVFNT